MNAGATITFYMHAHYSYSYADIYISADCTTKLVRHLDRATTTHNRGAGNDFKKESTIFELMITIGNKLNTYKCPACAKHDESTPHSTKIILYETTYCVAPKLLILPRMHAATEKSITFDITINTLDKDRAPSHT